VHQDPERNAGILRTLSAEAFTSPHRKEIYQIFSAMHLAGKAVDELTLDWQLAAQGVPLDAGPGGRAERDDQTYAMHLARLDYGYGEPAIAARELAAEHQRYPARRTPHGEPGARQTATLRRDATAARVPGRPALRLVQPPPQAGGPAERGPQQAR